MSNSAGTIGQSFDRAGRVTSDTRSLAGVTGAAGTGTQDFAYDAVSRLASSSISGVDSRSYQYDLDGNRTRRVENGTTSDFTYDRTDVARDQWIGATQRFFTYDRYGNLLQAPDKTSVYTTYGYDEASRPVSMAIAGGSTATFTVDPLDRKASRTVGAATDTYGYLGSTETAFETSSSGTRSLLDVDGSRLAVKNGGTVAWVIFDLHGSVAGLCSGTTVTDAYRYDAWGQTLAVYPGGSGTANPWRYRGLLGVAPGTNTDLLYDMVARDYAPHLGTFTQWDSVQGGAANPLSMNRYLYALANPATLIDPDGHRATEVDGCRVGDSACYGNNPGSTTCYTGTCGAAQPAPSASTSGGSAAQGSSGSSSTYGGGSAPNGGGVGAPTDWSAPAEPILKAIDWFATASMEITKYDFNRVVQEAVDKVEQLRGAYLAEIQAIKAQGLPEGLLEKALTWAKNKYQSWGLQLSAKIQALKGDAIKTFGSLGSKAIGAFGVGLSAVLGAAEQSDRDRQRGNSFDPFVQDVRNGLRGVVQGAAGLLGGLGAGALCSPLGPVAVGCAIGGGIAASEVSSSVMDGFFDFIDAEPRFEIRLW